MPTFRIAIVVAVVGALFADRIALAAEKLSFNRDIRPILSNACFQCHGPDEGKRQSGLRFDIREHALQPAESGKPAIVPGQAAKSELLRRIHANGDEQMPPADSGKTITPAQKVILERWIEEGAEYQGHWAFTAPVRPAPPDVQNAAWIKSPIDRFVLARLEHEGLKPSLPASKTTLLRRVTLDLTGLPPTPAEIDAFLSDLSPQAYEKVVDRLLQSPHYGERMALQWLDFARYADSNGFQTDGSRFQWPWRDWVIDAYNRNLPFDRFTIEQLAGDMLPDATTDQIVATGFNRNHRLNGEGGLIGEEWRVETVIDRVETTGLTWLGLTLNCCRCHDHKYDPITQKEFYQFFAFFNNVPETGTLQGDGKNTEPVIAVTPRSQQDEIARVTEELAAAKIRVADAEKQVTSLVAAWEPGFREQLKKNQSPWTLLDPSEVKSSGGAKFTKQPDGTYLASGPNASHDIYEITAAIQPGQFTGLLLECLPDESLPNKSLGRYPNGNFVLTRVEAEITAPSLKEPHKAKIAKVAADYSQQDWDIQHILGGNPSKGWAVDGPTKREPRRAMFIVEAPLAVPDKATLTVRLHHEAIDQHNIGRFRLSATSLPTGTIDLNGQQVPAAVRQLLEIEPAKRSAEQQTTLINFYRMNVDSPIKQAETAVAAIQKRIDVIRATGPTVMVMREGPVREAFRLNRGEYDQRGEKVTAGLPVSLPPLPAGAPANRLTLAQWIVSAENPLASRVWVNRAWEKFFGMGLVKTSENFGSQADYPSHPELLDWLACEFREPTVLPAVAGKAAQPWDMKAFQKLIVMSAAYQQSSHVTAAMLERDPENRLIARGPRIRLAGELVRDQTLAAAGLLTRTIGGPSVRPYMPAGVWDETSRYGDLRGYKHETGDGLYRRTMYTIWKRTAAPPTMLLFDAPNREVCTVKRSRTNTPLQALALLNEVTFVEAARKLGERILSEGGSTIDERLTFGFRVTVGRVPTASELTVLKEGLTADLERFKKNTADAHKLLAVGDTKSTATLDPAELAAYTLTANVLLNLDEFITRE